MMDTLNNLKEEHWEFDCETDFLQSSFFNLENRLDAMPLNLYFGRNSLFRRGL